MPPKKTKPNEKCPCGSGKKHKKCCMVAGKLASTVAAINTTVLDEVMKSLTLAITNTTTTTSAAASDSIVPCCHGSTSAHFPDGRAYNDVIKKFVAVYGDEEKEEKLHEDHQKDMKDSNFIQYVFALGTSWYLKMNTTNRDMKWLLLTATLNKYDPDKDKNKDKLIRYSRAITQKDDRGVINCLSRETKSFCDCMQAKKTEAKGMAKTERCYGCDRIFPRTGMLICSGCKLAMFCNEVCQTKNWPKHRESCQGLQKTQAEDRALAIRRAEYQRQMEAFLASPADNGDGGENRNGQGKETSENEE